MESNYSYIPKLQRYSRWSLGMHTSFHPTLYWPYDYLSMLGIKLIHVNKRGHRSVSSPWLGLTSKSNTNISIYFEFQVHRIGYTVTCSYQSQTTPDIYLTLVTQRVAPYQRIMWWQSVKTQQGVALKVFVKVIHFVVYTLINALRDLPSCHIYCHLKK